MLGVQDTLPMIIQALLQNMANMEQRFTRCILLVLSLHMSSHVQAIEIRTASQDSQPKYIASGKAMNGVCPAIWRAITRLEPQLAVEVPVAYTPLARIEMQIERGEIDAFCGLAKTTTRLKHMEFLLPPVYATNSVLAARIDDTQVIESWDDLRRVNATVLVNANSIHAKTLSEFTGLSVDDSAQTTSQNLRKLVAGRGRFVLHSEFSLTSAIQRDELGSKVKVLPTPLFIEARYIVVSRHADPVIKSRVSAALRAMQKSGELARIYAQYLPR